MTFITFMVSITFTGDTLVHEGLSLAERDAGIKGNSVFLYIIIFAIFRFLETKNFSVFQTCCRHRGKCVLLALISFGRSKLCRYPFSTFGAPRLLPLLRWAFQAGY